MANSPLGKISALLLSVALCFATVPLAYADGENAGSSETLTVDEQFIQQMAEAAGFQDSGEYIATVIGISTVAGGKSLVKPSNDLTNIDDSIIGFNRTWKQNLSSLIDAADYPAWSSLTSDQQSQYGTEQNYQATKFNSLLNAFGLGSDYAAYKQGFEGSGGSNFEFSTAAQNTLSKIGRIGSNWLNGIGNTVSDILDAVTSKSEIIAWLPPDSYYLDIDTTNVTWPEGVPTRFNIVNAGYEVFSKSANFADRTISVAPTDTRIFLSKGTRDYKVYTVNKNSYQTITDIHSNPARTETANALEATYNNMPVYYNYTTFSISIYDVGLPDSGDFSFSSGEERNKVLYYIAYSDVSSDVGALPIEGYPEDIESEDNAQTIIYYPAGGITSDTDWQDLLDAQNESNDLLNQIIALLQQFQFYDDTGELKVHDSRVYAILASIDARLNQIQSLLSRWFSIDTAPDLIGDFDFSEVSEKVPNLLETISELAPFGALSLLSEMIAILSTTGNTIEPTLDVPFEFGLPDAGLSVEIDLTWLDPLKPVINFACVITLVVGLLLVTWRVVEREAAG